MDVHVAVANPGNAAFGSIEFDVNGDGVPDFTATTIDAASLTWSIASPGLATLTVTVKNAQGAPIYTTARLAYAASPLERADTLVATYQSLMDHLALGDVDHAINLIVPHMADTYRAMFTALGSHLPDAAGQFGSVEHVMFMGEMGQLVVVRPTDAGPKAFFVNLIRGEDGIWRIDGM
jgi:hypothetical protein